MVYFILKLIVRLAIRVFYREISIQNKNFIPTAKNKALIIVANHPNTFMDALLISAILPQEIHFLSNGSVFKTNFHHWILNKLNMIPIYRQKDKNGGSEENQKTFEKCFEHLKKQKSILIFPEGTSMIERKIRPIKTGTARIALGAENFNHFQTNVEILPIGLNYEAQNYFHSKVHIHIGQTIHIKSLQENFEENQEKTVRILTQEIQEKLENLTIITENQQEDELVKQLEIVYKHEWKNELSLKKGKEYLLAKELTQAVEFFKNEDPTTLKIIQEKLSNYFLTLKEYNIHDKNIQNSTAHILFDGFYLILTFPLYVFGLLTNYLAYKTPSLLTYKITKDESYFAPIALSFGILSFISFYSLQGFLFYQILPSPVFLSIYLISLPIFGLFTFSYWKKIQFFLQEIRWKKLKKEGNFLHTQRQEIIDLLQKAKNTFLKNKEI